MCQSSFAKVLFPPLLSAPIGAVLRPGIQFGHMACIMLMCIYSRERRNICTHFESSSYHRVYEGLREFWHNYQRGIKTRS
ncbi:hypothetical protein BKA82DRAFT_4047651 [Pisolithus tinctorius]|nr:hypothetical protein BKA82DRAFT_4047651 [Pisolithus tinctorius]